MSDLTDLNLTYVVIFAVILAIPPVIALKFGKTVDRRRKILVSGAFAAPLACASVVFLTLHFFPR